MLFYVGSNFVLLMSCFRSKYKYFSVDKQETFPQLISNEVPDYITNILWICPHVFELGDFQLLGSTRFLTR